MSEFDILVDRSGMSTVKQAMTPESVKNSGITSLWGAEFEFPTAPFVRTAIAKWADNGLYAYTVDDCDFLSLVCNWMADFREWTVLPQWIVPVYGITSSLATAMRAFTQEGDGIIGLDPTYHMYWEAVELSGRRKVSVRLKYDGCSYSVDWDDLEKQASDNRNKMLVLCNPANPIAKVFSRDELQRISEICKKHNLIIFNDEIFAECVYPGVKMNTFGQLPCCEAMVITAVSLGKWLSFTGTNQANLIIPDDKIRESFIMQRNREFYGSMNPMMRPAYFAAYTAEGAKWVRDLMKYIEGNYTLVDSFFRNNLPEFKAVRPEGSFILWIDARAFSVRVDDLYSFLTEKAHFHIDPGPQYGGDYGFFRMTLSLPRSELSKALHSLKAAVDSTV
ncbi:MAG: aminotransferase class I/II-fold pyridoxal phosphate-dependent enzyme [Oscillospiraceae bacterium]|nr:aminotransferase class I/II-fold pyridoxal phosphate-dependent enzyme [Oscillospiraceae bacterium]